MQTDLPCRRGIVPLDGMIITRDTPLQPGLYFLPRGIEIGADGVALDGQGAGLVGERRQGQGITVVGRRQVTLASATPEKPLSATTLVWSTPGSKAYPKPAPVARASGP